MKDLGSFCPIVFTRYFNEGKGSFMFFEGVYEPALGVCGHNSLFCPFPLVHCLLPYEERRDFMYSSTVGTHWMMFIFLRWRYPRATKGGIGAGTGG